MSYTKLHSQIVNSSVWNADKETRIMWVTLLALQDRDHCVRGSIGGLAVQARLTVEEARRALHTLSQPDPDSQSTVHDGRRIIRLEDGAWYLVNGKKYRDLESLEDRRAKDAERKRRSRLTGRPHVSANVRDVTPSDQIRSDHDLTDEVVAKGPSRCARDPDAPAHDDDRTTTCPLDLAAKLPATVVPELAAAHRVSEAAIRQAIEEFVTYWTVGGGAGTRRKSWPRTLRQRIHELAKRGDLVEPAPKAQAVGVDLERLREFNRNRFAGPRTR